MTLFLPGLLKPEEENLEEEEEEEKEDNTGPDYNYLLNMPMWYLTKEKKEELCKQRDSKVWPSSSPSGRPS